MEGDLVGCSVCCGMQFVEERGDGRYGFWIDDVLQRTDMPWLPEGSSRGY